MSTFFTESREHVFTWKIENFKCCFEKRGDHLSSPIFVAESLDNSSWRLEIFPADSVTSDNDFISCYLQRDADDFAVREIQCEFRIEVIGVYDNIIFSNIKTCIFKSGDIFGWPNFIKRNLFMKECEKLCNNTLTIRCHLFSNIPRAKLCSENIAVTKIGVDHCSFRCVIENIDSSTNLRMMKFPSMDTSQLEVLIQIKGDDVRISICREDGFSKSQCVICKVDLLDIKGEVGISKCETHLFRFLNEGNTWEFPTFLKRSKLNVEKDKYLVENCFTLMFEFSVSNGSKFENIENVPLAHVLENPFDLASQIDNTMLMLRTDLSRLFSENIQSDVNLRVQDRVFPAHRSILSARSPVFFAMFSHDMAENKTGDVEIPDLDAETMKSLMKFIYTGETESLDYGLTSKLMMSANKYQIFSLKEKCAKFLRSILSIENVCDILVMADLVEHKILKASAVEFIKKHSGYIFSSNMWKSVVKKNLLLASETVSEVSLCLASNPVMEHPLIRKQPDKSSKSKNLSCLSKSSASTTASSYFSNTTPTKNVLSSSNGYACTQLHLPNPASQFDIATSSYSSITSNDIVSNFFPQNNSATGFSFFSPASSVREVSTSSNGGISTNSTKQNSSGYRFSFGSSPIRVTDSQASTSIKYSPVTSYSPLGNNSFITSESSIAALSTVPSISPSATSASSTLSSAFSTTSTTATISTAATYVPIFSTSNFYAGIRDDR